MGDQPFQNNASNVLSKFNFILLPCIFNFVECYKVTLYNKVYFTFSFFIGVSKNMNSSLVSYPTFTLSVNYPWSSFKVFTTWLSANDFLKVSHKTIYDKPESRGVVEESYFQNCQIFNIFLPIVLVSSCLLQRSKV